MRRLATALGAAMLLAGCATAPKPLYMWETFPRQQYETLLASGGSPDSQIQAMEAHAVKARGTGAALPPGFRAHLGMLYLSTGNAAQARQLWLAEKEAFPESSPYLDQLLKRMDGKDRTDKTTAKNENPA
ncbi:MAG TPA: DUF4810 domain-containing protein [Ramlibacter sp.]|jgi:hypothetical protein|uniref:DUF4810 domain-containing protein n=1 Tax=Ramlibacter sp. TaxID=1917967 RepID=UPI002D48DB47|nr:DUF4810 domain-containing protein [Ramlibacter sp.]HZY18336.1 DUF4810 domain-containing protein [Ramlibacter sp.]